MGGLVLETTFLIDLERERHRGVRGDAHRFLAAHRQSPVYLTFTTVGELAAGPRVDERAAWEDFVRPFEVLGWSKDVAWEYGRAFRYLSDQGTPVGSNDLWIAATALVARLPLVTSNPAHFRRVPALEVIAYRSI